MRKIAPSVPIGEVVEKIENWDPANSNSEEPFSYIDISSVDRETKAVLPAPVILPKEAPSRARQLVKAQDILVSTVRPNLNAVAQIQDELDGATASTGFCVLRTKKQIVDSSYLYFWFRTSEFIEEMVKRATGASYPAVSDSIIKSSKIPLPPLDEQRRIAAILNKADAIRRKRQESIRLTEAFLRSTFLEMFGDPVSNPKGWDSVKLEQICSKITDGTHKTPSYVESGVTFISAKNIKKYRLDWSDVKYITSEEHEFLTKRCKAEFGDILLSKSGSIGAAAKVRVNFEFSLFESLALIKYLRKKVNGDYLQHYLNSDHMKRRYVSDTKGLAIRHLHLNEIRNIDVLLPPINLQNRFSEIINTVESTSTKQVSINLIFNQLFESLSHRAFRGEL